MSLTLGLTGMDPATEVAIKTAISDANARLGNAWRLLPETEADHVLVDMDSMYGPMSWLRLHRAGKRVIGLTSAPRTQCDYQLTRPFDVDSVAALLRAIAESGGKLGAGTAAEPEAEATPAPTPVPAPTQAPTPTTSTPTRPHAPATATVEPVARALPSGMSPAPAPEDQLPAEHPLPLDEEAVAPPPALPPDSVTAGLLAPTMLERSALSRDPVFTDWLMPGALQGRRRYQRGGGPALLIDPISRQYHGPALLKPLAGYFEGSVRAEDFASVNDATWAKESTVLGAAQPLSRLQWYGCMLAGHGTLLPGHDPAGRYQLIKWPLTEREFPKQFRIATAMMKGPLTLEQVADASGVPLSDVTDFVSASLITGYAESVSGPAPEPPQPPKPGGLFRRLRGR